MVRKILVIAALSTLVVGCGGSKTTKGANDAGLPDWVMNPVKEAGYLFGAGIAEQSSPQLAIETADLRAKRDCQSTESTGCNPDERFYVSGFYRRRS